jgi:shikimate dehydrogenase
MINFGLIGKSLNHSFSKIYFEKKFENLGLKNYNYYLIEINSLNDFKNKISLFKNLKGLNVTIPYKEAIIPFLDELNETAKEIGAVNCIKIIDNRLIGYNTDVYGFAQSIKPFLDTNHQRALILGNGGAAKAVEYALKKIGIEVYFVSSKIKKTKNTFFYNEINELVFNAFHLIINTSPLGMHPKENESPNLPYHLFTPNHLAFDLIYNPEQTLFLEQAKKYGALTINGLSMLQLQAEKSWDIWNDNH